MNTLSAVLGSSTPPAMDRYLIPNLARACRMLDLLSGTRTPLSATEIARRLDMPRTTAFRILRTLRCEGIVIENDKGYVSGLGLMRIGLQALEGLEIRRLAPEVLQRLAHSTGETSHMGVLSGKQVLVLDVYDSPNALRVASRAGTLVDVHCSAMGKLLLAFRPRPELDLLLADLELQRRTPRTIVEIETLRNELERIRIHGYALDDEEYASGIRCLAAPVHDASSRVIASIGITAAASSIHPDRVPEVVARVRKHANQLSETLGYLGGQSR